MAADLATFQATGPHARSYCIDDVVEAMAPAFKLGFAYSLKSSPSELTVTLLHRSGWDMASTAPAEGTDEISAGTLLADLLGIRVHDSAAIAQQQPDIAETALTESDPACAMPQVAQPAAPFEVDDDQDEFAQETVPAELLVELTEADRNTCLSMVKVLKSDERKAFTIAFRSHFQVPREDRTIGKFITQVQHKKFVEDFINELERQALGAAA